MIPGVGPQFVGVSDGGAERCCLYGADAFPPLLIRVRLTTRPYKTDRLPRATIE